MHYNSQLNHLHLHIPKTGGTSLGRKLECRDYNKNRKEIEMLKSGGAHMSLNEIEKKPQMYSFFKDYYKTTTLRNPWDWAVSLYTAQFTKPNMIVNYGSNYEDVMNDLDPYKLSFLFFMRRSYKERNQQNWIKSSKLKFDEYFNFNNYPEIAKTLKNKFKFTIKSIPHINSKFTAGVDNRFVDLNKPYQDYYDDETHQMIKKYTSKVIDIFDYKIS